GGRFDIATVEIQATPPFDAAYLLCQAISSRRASASTGLSIGEGTIGSAKTLAAPFSSSSSCASCRNHFVVQLYQRGDIAALWTTLAIRARVFAVVSADSCSRL